MTDNSENNKRIAFNTIFMYIRMFVTMGLGLYTSRIVLKTLGVDDYGLYNVIGGIIAMFSFINGAMTNTTSRYITFFLGKNDKGRLGDIFSMSFLIHIFIALIIVLLGETIGLWYLYEIMVVPDGRFTAALWLYQLSIFTMVINILYVPFNALIVAYERMSAFAYISILEAFIKCLIALSIAYSPFDKLIYYGVLMFLSTLIVILTYYIYCKRHFKETQIHWFWDKKTFNEMSRFAGWSLFGNFSYVFYSQGINLILNIFSGTAVNAARGIAVQVESIVRQFIGNVQTALNPQIIKSYADGDNKRMITLIFASSRYCFYLIYLLVLPLILEAEYLLDLWLDEVPEHTVNFVRITLLMTTIDALSNPLFTANLATGRLKIYQTTLSVISFLLMPITYFAMKYTLIPETVFLCLFVCKILEQIARVFIAKKQINMSISLYFKKIVFTNIIICIVATIFPIMAYKFLPPNFIGFVCVCALSILSIIITVIVFGINNEEKKYISNVIKKKLSNH